MSRLNGVRGWAWLMGLVSIACLAPGPVPAPFTDGDINGPSPAGSATYDPVADQWVVTGGGYDIWGTADQFNFVSMPFPVPPGDGILSANVVSLVGNGGTIDVWAKAGVMWRETLAAGSTCAQMEITADNGNDFQFRTATGGGAADVGPGGNGGENGAGNLQHWVRVVKQGTTYTGFISTNGTAWTQFGTAPNNAPTITMTANPVVGLAVCAHNNGGTSGDSTSVTATFTNFTVTDLNGLYCWPLTAPTLAAPVPGYGSNGLSWTDASPSPITSYTVSRSTTAGGPYTVLATGVTGTTYTDNTAIYPTTYYYVVQAVGTLGTSVNSNEQSGVCLPPLITVNPTALTVAENGGQATFSVTLVQSPNGYSVTVPVTSGNPTDLQLTGPTGSGGTINLVFPANATGANLTQQVTITGQQVFQEGNPVNVQVTFGQVTTTPTGGAPYSGYNSGGVGITPVSCTIIEDTPALIVNPGALSITNGGVSVPFTVTLATIPSNTVNVALSVTDPTLASLSTGQIALNSGNWNTGVTVMLNPIAVNTQTTYVAPFDIILDPSGSLDTLYAGVPASSVPVNIPVSLPPLSKTWGSCGLTGLEGMLPLGLMALLRRLRRCPKR